MTIYTVYIIHGCRCPKCKKWIPELVSKKQDFLNDAICICGENYTAKQLLNDLNGKLQIKEFNSERLFKQIVDEYLKRNSSLEIANERAIRVVAREKLRFEQKYGFNKPMQQKLA